MARVGNAPWHVAEVSTGLAFGSTPPSLDLLRALRLLIYLLRVIRVRKSVSKTKQIVQVLHNYVAVKRRAGHVLIEKIPLGTLQLKYGLALL